MTDKLKPTAEQIQRACDIANANGAVWRIGNYGDPHHSAFTALADTLARAEKAEADLREVDALLEEQPPINSSLTDAQAIVASYRVEADPLAEALRAIHEKTEGPAPDWDFAFEADQLRAELAKRGVTVGEQTDAD